MSLLATLPTMLLAQPPGLKDVPQFTLEIDAQDIPIVITHEHAQALFALQKGIERQQLRAAQRQRLYRRYARSTANLRVD